LLSQRNFFNMKTLLLLLLASATFVASAVQHAVDPRTYHFSNGCNMNELYCHLRYDQYTFPGTHDSAANRLNLDCVKAKHKFTKALCRAFTHLIPKPIYDCFWNTQPGHDLVHQLHDGIRWLDLRGCIDGNNLLLCHGSGTTRALGIDFHTAFSEIAKFLNTYNREVITISFEASDGNPTVIYQHLISIVEQYLGDMMYVHDEGAGWPTLQEMIDSNQRVVIYTSWSNFADPSLPPWLHLNRNQLCYRTWAFSDTIHHSGQLRDAMMSFCSQQQPPAIANKWQTLEYTIPTALRTIEGDLKHFKKPEVCLKTFAKDEDQWMNDVARFCVPRMSFVHLVMVDYYFKSPVFQIVDWINEMNFHKAMQED